MTKHRPLVKGLANPTVLLFAVKISPEEGEEDLPAPEITLEEASNARNV